MVELLVVVELSDGKYDGDEEWEETTEACGKHWATTAANNNTCRRLRETARRTRRPSAGNGAPARKTESNFSFFFFFSFLANCFFIKNTLQAGFLFSYSSSTSTGEDPQN